MPTTNDAVIRLRLDTSQAEADLRRFQGSAQGVTVGARRMGMDGSGGGGGSGLLGAIRGAGLAGGAVAAGVGMFAAPGIGDVLGGLNGYIGGAGRNLAEMAGLGAFNRNSKVREKAEDATVRILGAAGSVASEAQVKSLYGVEKMLTKMDTDAENRVRSIIGGKETKDTMERVADVLDQILAFLTGSSLKSSVGSVATAVADGLSGIGRSISR